MDQKIIFIAIALLAVGLVVGFVLFNNPTPKPIHIHADFKVYINNIAYNFSQDKYMSTENHTLSPFIHLHDLNGDVIHQHFSGISLTTFFKSLKMKLDSNCLTTDTGSAYCNSGDKTLKMYVEHVNGSWTANYDFGNYEFQDLDKILISYGNDEQGTIQKQMNSLSNDSCIYSEKCPERGLPPPDERDCLGGDVCDAAS